MTYRISIDQAALFVNSNKNKGIPNRFEKYKCCLFAHSIDLINFETFRRIDTSGGGVSCSAPSNIV